MDLVFRFAERITVLVGGQGADRRHAGEIAADPRVREVYLGRGAAWLSCCALDGVTRRLRRRASCSRTSSLALDEGDSLALLGRNGVGKTTLLVTLMGLTQPARAARCAGAAPTSRALPTYRRAQAGIGWVPQERYMLPSLTVEEHLTAVARPGPLDLDARLRALPAARGAARATSATSSPAASSRCSRSRAR